MAQQLAIISPQLLIYVNNNIFGIAQDFSYTINYSVVNNVGIDIMGPVEVTPESFKISGSMKILRLILDGGPEGYGLLPNLNSLSLGKYLTVSIVDRTNGTLIFSSNTMIFSSQKWEFKSRTVAEGMVRI